MKNCVRCSLIIFSLLLVFSTLSSWANNSSGAAAPYLRQGVHARYLAMGNAGTATVNDSSAVIWNPAGIANLSKAGLTAQTAILAFDQSWQYLGFVYPVQQEAGPDYGFGFGWLSYSAGQELEMRTSNRPDPTKLFKDQQSAIVASLASNFGTSVYYGLNLKILLHQLDEDNANGFSLDFALWHQASASIQWGLVLQDTFGSITWPSEHQDNLPLVIRPGLSWQGFNQKLIVTADGGVHIDNRDNQLGHLAYHVGTEYWIFPTIAGRMGINDNQFTAGIGWDFKLSNLLTIGLDYAFAWERVEALGHSHLFSVDIIVNDVNQGEFAR